LDANSHQSGSVFKASQQASFLDAYPNAQDIVHALKDFANNSCPNWQLKGA
jgi:hypothetical protein